MSVAAIIAAELLIIAIGVVAVAVSTVELVALVLRIAVVAVGELPAVLREEEVPVEDKV